MVTGDLGVPGGAALNHVVLEQEKDIGSATILFQVMEGMTAVDHTSRQELATQELVDVVSTTKL